jgi:hypothetical protein
MLIREGEDLVEITYRDADPHDEDVLLHVSVASSGFKGESDVWVEGAQLRAFLHSVEEFEIRRQGSVEIGSMSPDLFRLRVMSVDRKGHLAVKGRLGTIRHGLENRYYISAIEFAFEFDPGQLASFLRELRSVMNTVARQNCRRDAIHGEEDS